VAAASEGCIQEDFDHFEGGGGGDDAGAEGKDVGVVVFAGELGGDDPVGRAARITGTLLAAMEIPTPEPQTAMPRSAFFEATRSPTALP
jgi:hypothetical protein